MQQFRVVLVVLFNAPGHLPKSIQIGWETPTASSYRCLHTLSLRVSFAAPDCPFLYRHPFHPLIRRALLYHSRHPHMHFPTRELQVPPMNDSGLSPDQEKTFHSRVATVRKDAVGAYNPPRKISDNCPRNC